MFHAQRFYWILLHTSMRRLYTITIGTIIICFSIWFYFWYIPFNRAIQKLSASSISHSVDVHTQVNTTNEHTFDHAQQLSRVAECAGQSGIQMKRMHMQNDYNISFEGKGSIAQLISFFELLEKEHQSFHCVQMNMHKDCADLFTVHMQIA